MLTFRTPQLRHLLLPGLPKSSDFWLCSKIDFYWMRMSLPLIFVYAKYVLLLTYCSKCGTCGNNRHLPSNERRLAFFFHFNRAIRRSDGLDWVWCNCDKTHGITQWSRFKCLILEALVGYPSGQRGQTVNLLAMPSMVRIHHLPPLQFRPIESISSQMFAGMLLLSHNGFHQHTALLSFSQSRQDRIPSN